MSEPKSAAPGPAAPAQPPGTVQPRVWTTLDLINWTKSFFEKKGIESPLLEAQLLLAEVLGCARIRLYVDFEKPVSPEHLARYREFVKRRSDTREPLQYILGHTQFIDLQLKVNPSALIPRPETEILAVWAVDRARQAAPAPRVLDLCTGSGCIALYLASKLPEAEILASDVSPAALSLARENAAALKLDTRVEFLEADLYAAERFNTAAERGVFDVIVTNPPYIDRALKESLQPEVRVHEPELALYAEHGGLEISERIIRQTAAHLKPGGWMGLEFGAGQGEQLREIAAATGAYVEIALHADSARMPRFLMARKPL